MESRTRLVDLDLLDFVPALTPRLLGHATERPEHLAPIVEFFERVERGEVVKMLVSAPPQYGKSVVIGHGIARTLARHWDWPIIYASYGADLAVQKSRDARDWARAVGVELREDADAVGTWLTEAGGGLRARGIGGPTTGNPAKIFIIDDPHKERRDADSALAQQRVEDWYNAVADTRMHPDSSVLVAHARWSTGDLIGRLSKRKDKQGRKVFEHVNLPSILPSGLPLWHHRPIEWLEEKQVNEHDWHSLWMGSPRDRGDRVFKGLRFYDKLPIRFRIGKGIDLAVTEKTSACHSASVVLLENEGLVYVVDVRRAQVEVPAFARELAQVDVVWPGFWHWFTSTTEAGTAQLLTELAGVVVQHERARVDKFNRAQAIAAAWNAGHVLIPRDAPWLRDFVDEVGLFTGGKGDASNDQVDALASAYEGVRYPSAGKPRNVPGSGTRYAPEANGRSFW